MRDTSCQSVFNSFLDNQAGTGGAGNGIHRQGLGIGDNIKYLLGRFSAFVIMGEQVDMGNSAIPEGDLYFGINITGIVFPFIVSVRHAGKICAGQVDICNGRTVVSIVNTVGNNM